MQTRICRMEKVILVHCPLLLSHESNVCFSGRNALGSSSPRYDHYCATGRPVSGLSAYTQHHVHNNRPENHELWRYDVGT